MTAHRDEARPAARDPRPSALGTAARRFAPFPVEFHDEATRARPARRRAPSRRPVLATALRALARLAVRAAAAVRGHAPASRGV